MAAGKPGPRTAILLLLAVLAWASPVGAAHDPRQPDFASTDPVFLGPHADHFVDPTGTLSLPDVLRDPARFIPADGRVPSHGFAASAQAALWLRVKMPLLDSRLRVLSIELPRVLRADIWWPAGSGFGHQDWDAVADAERRRPLTRNPAFDLDADEISGGTIYLRINATSALRPLIWLRTQRAFVVDTGLQNVGFGMLIGILIGLYAYLLATSIALRDESLGRLSATVLAFLAYILADQGYVETAIVPGGFTLSRIVSITATLLVYAGWLWFANGYLALDSVHPRLSRVLNAASLVLLALAIEVGVEAALGLRLLRLWLPLAGIPILAGTLVLAGVVALRPQTRRRGLAFILCWTPAVASGVMHILPNAAPSVGASPILVDTVYVGVTLSLLAFGLVASFDIQKREHRLLAATRESEARFRGFAESASDSYWQTEPGGQLSYVAGALAEAVGLRSGHSLVHALAAAGAGAADLGALDHAMTGGQPFRSLPVTITGPRGEIRHLALSGMPLFAPDGAPSGFRGAISDVTRERNAAQREAQQQKMAALGQLAGGIAHEINNLLHPIINMSRRLRDGTPPDDPKRYQLDLVVDAGLRASEIVSAVLTSARPSATELQKLPLREGLDRSLDAMRPLLPRAVALDVRCEPIDGPALSPGEVMQVIGNLVGNAVQAMEGGGHITVSLRGTEQGSLVLTVADDGHGMPAATLPRALEPFFSTRTAEGGTGLGLSIVSGIVSGWGGSLDIVSELGRGTQVVITLPRPQCEPEEPDHGATALAGAGG